jgi:hypothetical protein
MLRTVYFIGFIILSYFVLWMIEHINTVEKSNIVNSVTQNIETTNNPFQLEPIDSEWLTLETRLNELNKLPSTREDFFSNINQDSKPVELYIAALLKFSEANTKQSYELISAININEIPGDHLYFPYRLFQIIKPDSKNPYLNALLKADKNEQLSALIKARTLGFNGQLTESLEAYLATNPNNWKQVDLDLFRKMIMFNGLKTDTQRMLYAAWKSGNIDNDVAMMLRDIAINGDKKNKQELHQIKQRINDNPTLMKVAKDSVIKMSQARKLFINKDYVGLLTIYKDIEPHLISTEIVTLLFLSAAKTEQITEVYQWGQEITRRHTDEKVSEWISRITREIS